MKLYSIQLTCVVKSDEDALAVQSALAALSLPASLITRNITVTDSAALCEMIRPVLERAADAVERGSVDHTERAG